MRAVSGCAPRPSGHSLPPQQAGIPPRPYFRPHLTQKNIPRFQPRYTHFPSPGSSSPYLHRCGPDSRKAPGSRRGIPVFLSGLPYPGHCGLCNSPVTARRGQKGRAGRHGPPGLHGTRRGPLLNRGPHISGKCSRHRPYSAGSSSVPRSLRNRLLLPGYPGSDPGCRGPLSLKDTSRSFY